MKSESQNTAIRDYLLGGNSLTPMKALHEFGCFRLGARIYDLKKKGWKIDTEMIAIEDGKRVASYTMTGDKAVDIKELGCQMIRYVRIETTAEGGKPAEALIPLDENDPAYFRLVG